MKVGFGATILINAYKFSSGSSMASIPYVQDKKKDTLKSVSFFLDTWVLLKGSAFAEVLPAAKRSYGAKAPPHRVGPQELAGI